MILRAVLQQDDAPWYHITRAEYLEAIVRDGLSPRPTTRTYESGFYETLGGIYVTPELYLPDVIRFIQIESRTFEVVVLRLQLLAGTRFCLDEDELNDWHDESGMGREVSVRAKPGIDQVLLQEAVNATVPEFQRKKFDKVSQRWFMQTIVVDQEIRREKLELWSCRLARELDQRELQRWRLRLFNAPKIVDFTQIKR